MFSLYVNNNTNDPTKIVNSTGNAVTINLSPPIILDQTKRYQLRVLQANIVFCQPNITSANNQFTYIYNGTTYTKTIPIGLYGTDDLNTTIGRLTTAQNGNQLFVIKPNEACDTTIVYFLTADTFIDCSTPNNVMSILGFPTSAGQIGGYPDGDGSVESGIQASINTLQLILIRSNITNGSYLNSQQK